MARQRGPHRARLARPGAPPRRQRSVEHGGGLARRRARQRPAGDDRSRDAPGRRASRSAIRRPAQHIRCRLRRRRVRDRPLGPAPTRTAPTVPGGLGGHPGRVLGRADLDGLDRRRRHRRLRRLPGRRAHRERRQRHDLHRHDRPGVDLVQLHGARPGHLGQPVRPERAATRDHARRGGTGLRRRLRVGRPLRLDDQRRPDGRRPNVRTGTSRQRASGHVFARRDARRPRYTDAYTRVAFYVELMGQPGRPHPSEGCDGRLDRRRLPLEHGPDRVPQRLPRHWCDQLHQHDRSEHAARGTCSSSTSASTEPPPRWRSGSTAPPSATSRPPSTSGSQGPSPSSRSATPPAQQQRHPLRRCGLRDGPSRAWRPTAPRRPCPVVSRPPRPRRSPSRSTWAASTDDVGVGGYDVYRGGTLLASLGNVTTYTDTSVLASTTYSYTVRARDTSGNPSGAVGAAPRDHAGVGGARLRRRLRVG